MKKNQKNKNDVNLVDELAKRSPADYSVLVTASFIPPARWREAFDLAKVANSELGRKLIIEEAVELLTRATIECNSWNRYER